MISGVETFELENEINAISHSVFKQKLMTTSSSS